MTGIVIAPPLAITPAMITATDVPETDYPAWSPTTPYALGDRVIVAAQHKVYESISANAGAAVQAFMPGVGYPIVIYWFKHGMAVNDQVLFASTGTMPGPLVAGTPYYAVPHPSPGYDFQSLFCLATTPGGTPINYTVVPTGDLTAFAGLNRDPTTPAGAAYWAEVSPTNRYKLFDTKNNSRTAQANSFYFELTTGQVIDTVYVGAVVGATSARVRYTDPVAGVVFDQSADLTPLPLRPDFWEWCFGNRLAPVMALFTGIPPYPNAVLRVDFTGGADLAVGALLVLLGTEYGKGISYGARAGRVSYSVQKVNEFGDMDLVQRPTAQKLQAVARIDNLELDALDAHLAALDSMPCLFICYAGYGVTTVFGIYKSYEILIAYPTASDVSFDFLGFI